MVPTQQHIRIMVFWNVTWHSRNNIAFQIDYCFF